MLTYVIRRLLYSDRRPLRGERPRLLGHEHRSRARIGFLRMQPNISEQTITNISERKHLNDPIYERYGYWVKDMFTNKFGTETVSRPADLARPPARDGPHASAHHRGRAPGDPHRRLHRGVLRVTAVQRLRLHRDDVQLRGPGDACLLARAHAAGAVREHLPLVRRAHLLRREPELGRSGERHSTSCSTARSTWRCRSSSSRSRASRNTLASCAPRCSKSSTPTTSAPRGRRGSTSAR